MFNYRDFSSEEKGMHGAGQIADVVNIQRVDANECHASFHEVFGGVPGQNWMALEILVRSPVGIPACAGQDGFASKIVVLECGTANRSAFREISGDRNGIQVGQEIGRASCRERV